MNHRNDRQTMGSMIDWDFVEEQNRKDRYADNARRKRKGIKTSKELELDPTPIPVRLPPQGHIAIEETVDGEKQHLCPVCEKPFTRESSGWSRLKTFCSEECRHKDLARRARERYAEKRARRAAMIERANEKTEERGQCVCPECGGLFFPRKQCRPQKYCCHACAQRATNRRFRERHGY